MQADTAKKFGALAGAGREGDEAQYTCLPASKAEAELFAVAEQLKQLYSLTILSDNENRMMHRNRKQAKAMGYGVFSGIGGIFTELFFCWVHALLATLNSMCTCRYERPDVPTMGASQRRTYPRGLAAGGKADMVLSSCRKSGQDIVGCGPSCCRHVRACPCAQEADLAWRAPVVHVPFACLSTSCACVQTDKRRSPPRG